MGVPGQGCGSDALEAGLRLIAVRISGVAVGAWTIHAPGQTQRDRSQPPQSASLVGDQGVSPSRRAAAAPVLAFLGEDP